MPLRLAKDCQEFRSAAKASYIATMDPNDRFAIGDAPATSTMPYPAVEVAYMTVPGSAVYGDLVTKPLNSIWGAISCRNLSAATAFAFYFRVCIECRVTPTSPLAPQQTVSPLYDPLALASYFRISRELKDAYPADYNDLGTLWEDVKQIAKTVAGGLSFIPGPVGTIAGMVHKVIPDRKPAPKQRDTSRRTTPIESPSAAQKLRNDDAAHSLSARFARMGGGGGGRGPPPRPPKLSKKAIKGMQARARKAGW